MLKRILERIDAWRARGPLPFKEMPDFVLVIIALACAVQVWFWKAFLDTMTAPVIETSNAYGFPPVAFAVLFVLASAGVVVMYSGAVLARCGYLLGERHLT